MFSSTRFKYDMASWGVIVVSANNEILIPDYGINSGMRDAEAG